MKRLSGVATPEGGAEEVLEEGMTDLKMKDFEDGSLDKFTISRLLYRPLI